MPSKMLTEGILSIPNSQISSAEIICTFMFGGAFHLTYFAVAENKLVNSLIMIYCLIGQEFSFTWTLLKFHLRRMDRFCRSYCIHGTRG
jgi:hypothetical protein